MFNSFQLNPKHYFSGAIVIGCFQIVDGLSALMGIMSDFARAFSVLEIFWLLVTLVYLRSIQRKQISMLVPNLYLAYMIYGFIVGNYLLSTLPSGAELALPIWYIISATLFGLLYTISSIKTYRKNYLA